MYQKIAEIMGKDGCYIFSLVYLAEKVTRKNVDALDVYRQALELGYIEADCYVKEPVKLMEMMTGTKWAMAKGLNTYITKKDEYEILRFEYTEGRSTIGHFVCGDGTGKVEYDPYGDSKTVRTGRLVSKRIFWKV
jgi:hypothetical protein